MDATQNLINQAIELHKSGKTDKAIELYKKLLIQEKKNSRILFLLGTAYIQIKKYDYACNFLKRAIILNNTNIASYYNYGFALHRLKRNREAIKIYKQAISIKNDDPKLFNNLGTALIEIEAYDEAIDNFKKSIELKLDFIDPIKNIAVLMMNLNRNTEAINYFYRIIELKPDSIDAYINLGILLRKSKRYEEALNIYFKAIEIKKDYFEIYNNLGYLLAEADKKEQALEYYKKAIELNPNSDDVYNNLGNLYKKLELFKEAINCYEQTLKINPNYPFTLGELLLCKRLLFDFSDNNNLIEKIKNALSKKKQVASPGLILYILDDPHLSKISGEIWIRAILDRDNHILRKYDLENQLKKKNQKKLRIGYYSADFYDHAMMHLMMDIFKNHSKEIFEIYAFSFGPEKKDKWKTEIEKYFDKFIDIKNMSDEEVFNLSQKLEIDIAVDLMGHTKNSRIGIFFNPIAPIKISYLGYPGTTGAKFIDYIIGDKITIPKKNLSYFSEKVLYLPNCYQANINNRKISSHNYNRIDFKLPEDSFVFCCFNNILKITPEIFDAWIYILKKIPNSVLWLIESNAETKNNIHKEAKIRKLDADRIIFSPAIPVENHLKRISLADLFLDTFPYNGHTTMSDAIRMGLPAITLCGKSFASRVGASILSRVGLQELITKNKNDYIKLALNLATDTYKLKKIRNNLKKSLINTSLFNSKKFIKDLESIYIKLINNHNIN